jgi:hypothetical protein
MTTTHTGRKEFDQLPTFECNISDLDEIGRHRWENVYEGGHQDWLRPPEDDFDPPTPVENEAWSIPTERDYFGHHSREPWPLAVGLAAIIVTGVGLAAYFAGSSHDTPVTSVTITQVSPPTVTMTESPPTVPYLHYDDTPIYRMRKKG